MRWGGQRVWGPQWLKQKSEAANNVCMCLQRSTMTDNCNHLNFKAIESFSCFGFSLLFMLFRANCIIYITTTGNSVPRTNEYRVQKTQDLGPPSLEIIMSFNVDSSRQLSPRTVSLNGWKNVVWRVCCYGEIFFFAIEAWQLHNIYICELNNNCRPSTGTCNYNHCRN